MSTPKKMEEFRRSTPLGRNGQAVHVVRAIAFLIENGFLSPERPSTFNGGLFMR